MRWLNPGSERAVRFVLGAALIVHEGFVRDVAQPYLLTTGLVLLAAPDLVRFDRWLNRMREQEEQREDTHT